MHVAEMMSHTVPVCGPEDTLREALGLMTREGLDILPVVAPDGRLLGIVTMESLRSALVSAGVEHPEANIESIRNLELNLREHGLDLSVIPYALQFNKRDVPDVVPVEEMYRVLNLKREPTFEAVATTGVGVFDTLKSVAKQILIELKKR